MGLWAPDSRGYPDKQGKNHPVLTRISSIWYTVGTARKTRTMTDTRITKKRLILGFLFQATGWLMSGACVICVIISIYNENTLLTIISVAAFIPAFFLIAYGNLLHENSADMARLNPWKESAKAATLMIAAAGAGWWWESDTLPDQLIGIGIIVAGLTGFWFASALGKRSG
jgi:hypothetical protein